MKYFVFLAIGIKIFFFLFVSYNSSNDKEQFSINTHKKYVINNDEGVIANIGYTITKTNQFRETNYNSTTKEVYYTISTPCPIFPVYIHVVFISFYKNFINNNLGDKDIFLWENPGRKSNYFFCFSLFISLLSLVLFLASIIPFMRLIEYCGIRHNTLSTFITILYILFPSSLIYIGLLTQYENIALPCLVIIAECIISVCLLKKEESRIILFVKTLLIIFSTLIRPQLTIILFTSLAFIVLVLFINYFRSRILPQKNTYYLLSFIFWGMLFAHGSIIVHNYLRVWGKSVYNTRGDALLTGHNPMAKGSWDGKFAVPGSMSYNYQLKTIPNFTKLSGVELSKAQSKLAIEWIFSNPKKELILICRKVAIFFLPYNYDHLQFDVILFLVYSATIFSFCYALCILLFKRKSIDINHPVLFIQIIILSVLFVNILYFVEYRIRYFADPFMILTFGVVLQKIISFLKLKTND